MVSWPVGQREAASRNSSLVVAGTSPAIGWLHIDARADCRIAGKIRSGIDNRLRSRNRRIADRLINLVVVGAIDSRFVEASIAAQTTVSGGRGKVL